MNDSSVVPQPDAEERMSLSVCIATCNRVPALTDTLDALLRQTRLPDEIVVSEPAEYESRELVLSVAARHPELRVRYVESERKALPWQRWWAFQHSTGAIAVFLDDDVSLASEALEVLEDAYRYLEEGSVTVAGVGFQMTFEEDDHLVRRADSLRERWLGTSDLPGGSLTPGGLSVTLGGRAERTLTEVEVLWGGAMSYRRQVLERINCLTNLVALYDAGVGRGEDAVLSHRARDSGRLFAITAPLALHPSPGMSSGPAPYAVQGWRLGLAHTWGRAHTMRWLAENLTSYKQDWWRCSTLELVRCLKAILRHPLDRNGWIRLAGAAYGIAHSLLHWAEIPPLP
jgi:hypothetical protein